MGRRVGDATLDPGTVVDRTLFIGGTCWTGLGATTGALAVEHDRIVALGSDAIARRTADTRVVDLGGGSVARVP